MSLFRTAPPTQRGSGPKRPARSGTKDSAVTVDTAATRDDRAARLPSLAEGKPFRTGCAPFNSGSGPRWVTYEDAVLDDGDFKDPGVSLDQSKIPDHGRVGNADCHLMPLCKIVDFA